MRATARLFCTTAPARVSWGAALRGMSRQVYGRVRRVQLNVQLQQELQQRQDGIEPDLIDAAEEEVRRKYWGDFGDGGAVGAASAPPELMMKMSDVLAFCIREDPALRPTAEGTAPVLTKYETHKSAVCQSLYLMTVEQTQRLLSPQLLQLLAIEVMSKAQAAGCLTPQILPDDKDSIAVVFQHWSDVAKQEAGVADDDDAPQATADAPKAASC